MRYGSRAPRLCIYCERTFKGAGTLASHQKSCKGKAAWKARVLKESRQDAKILRDTIKRTGYKLKTLYAMGFDFDYDRKTGKLDLFIKCSLALVDVPHAVFSVASLLPVPSGLHRSRR
jgi:hypothetical protein